MNALCLGSCIEQWRQKMPILSIILDSKLKVQLKIIYFCYNAIFLLIYTSARQKNSVNMSNNYQKKIMTIYLVKDLSCK